VSRHERYSSRWCCCGGRPARHRPLHRPCGGFGSSGTCRSLTPPPALATLLGKPGELSNLNDTRCSAVGTVAALGVTAELGLPLHVFFTSPWALLSLVLHLPELDGASPLGPAADGAFCFWQWEKRWHREGSVRRAGTAEEIFSGGP
jgi:hypothetical protein